MFARVLLGCVALCALAFASLSEEPKEVKETKFKPVAVFRGSHSDIRGTEFALVTTETEWKKLWSKHRGKEANPLFTETYQDLEIDFDSHYVAAMFTGDGAHPLFLTPQLRGDTVAIGFAGEIYSTEGRPPLADKTDHEKAKERAAARYTFVVLAKPVKTVVIEENIQYRRGEQPLWKERATFPAPKDKK